MKSKKTIFNLIFLLVCFCLTMYYVFHGQDLESLLHYIKRANWWYWLIGVVLVIGFILSESVIIFYMMKSLKQKIKISHCFLYSFIGFFFSLVTPSASGGQPAQILFMKKDKLPIHLSTLVLMIVTITYKLVLVIFGLIVLIIRPAKIIMYLQPVMHWMYLGIVLNIVCVGVMLMLVFSPNLARKIVMSIFRLVKRIAKSEKVDSFEHRLEKSIDGYNDAAEFFRNNTKIIINVLLITVLQRCFLFYITYLVFISFGTKSLPMVDIVVLQAMISMAVDMLPLPGGMGISEHLFQMIFLPICGISITVPAMIVSRGISFYTQLLISALFTVIAYFIFFKGSDKNDRIL